MKLLHASIFTLFCTSVQANTVNSHLTEDYLQNLNEDNSLSININDTSGYFIYLLNSLLFNYTKIIYRQYII